MHSVIRRVGSASLLLSTVVAAQAGAPPLHRPGATHWGEDGLRSIDLDGDGAVEWVLHGPGEPLLVLSGTDASAPGAPEGLRDVTLELGLDPTRPLERALWCDPDGDGWWELLALGDGAELLYLDNVPGRGFVDRSEALGPTLRGVRSLWFGPLGPVDPGGAARGERLVVSTDESVHVLEHGIDGRFRTAIAPVTRALSSAASHLARNPVPGRGVSAQATEALAGRPELAPLPGTPRSRSTADPRSGAPGGDLNERRSADAPSPAGPTPSTTQPLQLGGGRARSLLDVVTGGTLTASSVPELGRLYPLSSDWFVQPVTGRVGVGTINPDARLNVFASGETGLHVVGWGARAAHLETNDTSVPAVHGEAPDGGTAALFEPSVSIGYRLPPPLNFQVERLRLDADFFGAGRIQGMSGASLTTFDLRAEESVGDGARFSLHRGDGDETVRIDADQNFGDGSAIYLYHEATSTVGLESNRTGAAGGALRLDRADGDSGVLASAQGDSGEAQLTLHAAAAVGNGPETIKLLASDRDNGGKILLRREDGTTTVTLAANVGGKGRVTTDVLAITGGADLVEGFRAAKGAVPQPGSVVALDPDGDPGVCETTQPYDPRVVGIVSGAGGVEPGLLLGQRGVLEGEVPVALTGRVYVRCCVENGAVRAGDLLTSSSLAGHAMRASDPARAFGSVIGKALGSLEEGTGLVLVLVNLR